MAQVDVSELRAARLAPRPKHMALYSWYVPELTQRDAIESTPEALRSVEDERAMFNDVKSLQGRMQFLGDEILGLLDRADQAQTLEEAREIIKEARRQIELILDLASPED
ncbi:hypothetical protein [Alsobacter sp. SYSU BS001988]